MAVKACNKLGLKLIIAGRGPELPRLKKLAGSTVSFVEGPSDSQITKLYLGARGFIFSAEEDFGITPVEAMSAGLPVICFGEAGATHRAEAQLRSGADRARLAFLLAAFDTLQCYRTCFRVDVSPPEGADFGKAETS